MTRIHHPLDDLKILERNINNTIFAPLLERDGLKRLKEIRFLGTMPYIVQLSREHSRYEHTLGVAYLATKLCSVLDLSEDTKNKLIVAALIHDIGHTPLSHVGEVLLRRYHGQFHESQGLFYAQKIARELEYEGEKRISKYVHQASKILSDSYITKLSDEEKIVHDMMKSVVSLDGLDGITRIAIAIGIEYPDPLEIISGFSLKDKKLYFDTKKIPMLRTFFELEYGIYKDYISSSEGIVTQAMLTRALEIAFKTEKQLKNFFTMTDGQVYESLHQNPLAKDILQALESGHLYCSLKHRSSSTHKASIDKINNYRNQNDKSYLRNGHIIEKYFQNAIGPTHAHQIIFHPSIEKHFNFKNLFGQRYLEQYIDKPLPISKIYDEYTASRTYGYNVDIIYPQNIESDVVNVCKKLSEQALSQFSEKIDTPKTNYTEEILKRKGEYPTPERLVNYMVRWAVRDSNEKILDPACGDGRFLYSAYKNLLNMNVPQRKAVKLLYGVEIDPQYYGQTLTRWVDKNRPSKEQILNKNFFDIFSSNSKSITIPEMDVVIGNPPYIFHDFKGGGRDKALKMASKELKKADFENIELSQRSSSWSPYLIHSISFLKKNGRLAMVLPKELLTAQYADKVREYLRKKFRSLIIVSFDYRVFPELQQDVVVLFASQDEPPGIRNIIIHTPSKLEEDPFRQINIDPSNSVSEWLGDKWTKFLVKDETINIIESLIEEKKVIRLGDIAKISLGLVTGNNKFFILSQNDVKLNGIKSKYTRQIISKASQASSAIFTDKDYNVILENNGKCLLLKIPSDTLISKDSKLYGYLEEGLNKGIADGYKCAKRWPWYNVPYSTPPDAFLTYMSGKHPRLISNSAAVNATNSFHYINFNPNITNHNAYIASFYSTAAKLSLELVGRGYGGGVLKLEISDSRQILLPNLANASKKVVNTLESLLINIDSDLRKGETSAIKKIDQIINKKVLGLSENENRIISEEYQNLQRYRLKK